MLWARVDYKELVGKKSDFLNPPVTISLSDRPGHFFSIRFLTRSASDHTTVSQIGVFFIFFSNTFRTLNVSEHTTVSQTRFKKPQSVRPCYGHWHPGVKCLKKNRSDRPWYGKWGLLTHQWPYEFNKPQWPYHGLSDRFFFLRHFIPGR